jgi:2-methylcitrate dehydratase PrpD
MEKLLDGLGTDWAIEPPWLKSYPTHVTQQAVVEAIQGLKHEQPFDAKAITRVVIRGAPRIMEERHTTREPADVLGGQYSLPFTTAVALTRDLSNPLVYDAEAVADPLVRDLASRIELEPVGEGGHEAPGVWPAEILIECAGQRHLLQTRPYKGSPPNPFTWDEAREKFRRYTASVLDTKRSAAIIDAVGDLDRLPDIADLASLLSRA